MNFELIHKPTFTNQLLAVPKEQVLQILQKLEVLRTDPAPHGKLKKKLHGYKGSIYRLRSGNYRIVYSYGDGWVTLLGVDQRKDVYKGDKLVADDPQLNIHDLPTVQDLLTPQPGPAIPKVVTPVKTQVSTEHYLPVKITTQLLENLFIPNDCFDTLLACETFDQLLEAPVPEAVRDRLFDCITSPNFDQVLTQPSFKTGSPDSLLKFKQGELLGFLLQLNPEQEKFVNWSLNASGPTLLKGGPGTGKSTVALYRARAVLETLRNQGIEAPKLLFTTYTNALVSFSQSLLDDLLGKDSRCVKVQTADALLYSFVAQHKGQPKIANSNRCKSLLKAAIDQTLDQLEGNPLQQQSQRQLLQRLSPEYLLEEINSLIEGRNLQTLEDYLAVARRGRAIALGKTQRRAIWQLRGQFVQQLKTAQLETWSQFRRRALTLLEQALAENPEQLQRYDAVIIDEAQDLEPTVLRALALLCKAPNRLFVTADANQSIYGSGFRWDAVHQDLKFTGRTGILRTNHRTTAEINEAAHQYLNAASEGLIDSDIDNRSYIHYGPPPAVRALVASGDDEGLLIAQFCRLAAREFRLGIQACAVLVPGDSVGKQLVSQLQGLGLPAEFMNSKNLDLKKPGVKVLPLKAAKGLEFPIVAIAGFLKGTYPKVPKGATAAEQVEVQARERRTLFVAMTRAMRALLVVIPENADSPLLKGFAPERWNLGISKEVAV